MRRRARDMVFGGLALVPLPECRQRGRGVAARGSRFALTEQLTQRQPAAANTEAHPLHGPGTERSRGDDQEHRRYEDTQIEEEALA